MATLYTQQTKNVEKTWGLMIIFVAVVIGLGWIFSYQLRNPAILYGAAFFAVFANVFSYWFSDKIVLLTTGAEPADPMQYRELHQVVENLAITAGLPKPAVYIVDDPAPNAFATGRDKHHAVVAVTSGILPLLNRSELEGVIAHELSHVGNRDILVSTIAAVLLGVIVMLSDFFMRMSFWGGGRRDDREGNNQLGLILGVLAIVLAILSPIIAQLIQLAISRKRELLADASGALLTRYPEGLASALVKISKYGAPLVHANNATAHLYIENPFGADAGHATSWLAKLFLTHPPVEERVAALLGNRSKDYKIE